jgi:hypothetical protein
MEAAMWGSPLAVDGKIYLTDGEAATCGHDFRERKLLCRRTIT